MQTYSEAALPTLRPQKDIIKHLDDLKEEIASAPESTPEDIVRLVYGACYVMVESDSELTWHESTSTTPNILALHLTFKSKLLARKLAVLQQSLFKKVYKYTSKQNKIVKSLHIFSYNIMCTANIPLSLIYIEKIPLVLLRASSKFLLACITIMLFCFAAYHGAL